MYKITLEDGTRLDNVRLNGNNFIVNYEVTEDTFRHKLGKVLIESDDPENADPAIRLGEHENMELVAIQYDLYYIEPGDYWFVLADIPAEQLRLQQMQSDIEYIAMMTDTEM